MDNFGSEKDVKRNNFDHNSDYILYNQQMDKNRQSKGSDLYGSSRTKFIRKVYTILSFQLLLTTIMTLFSILNQNYFLFQIQNLWLIAVAFVIVIIIEIYMFCCGGARKYPQDIILTLIFTLCQGYIVSFIASVTGKTSGNPVVFLAAASTLAITIACTLYAIYTKEDYTTSYALLVVLSVAMLILFIILIFTDSPFIHSLFYGIGVFLFGCYLVIDTQMIVGGRSIQLGMDECYVGALLLYIDIITIFLYLLQLFKGND